MGVIGARLFGVVERGLGADDIWEEWRGEPECAGELGSGISSATWGCHLFQDWFGIRACTYLGRAWFSVVT